VFVSAEKLLRLQHSPLNRLHNNRRRIRKDLRPLKLDAVNLRAGILDILEVERARNTDIPLLPRQVLRALVAGGLKVAVDFGLQTKQQCVSAR
jgi:hypothetical protein